MGLAYVPRARHFPGLTVRENLLLAARAETKSNAWTLERVLITFPRLGERMAHRAATCQAASSRCSPLARLDDQPRLLLLDERPRTRSADRTRHLAHDQNVREAGMAMVIVDKNFAMLSELADRCVVLVKGRKVFDAAPGVLAAEPGLRERYLCMRVAPASVAAQFADIGDQHSNTCGSKEDPLRPRLSSCTKDSAASRCGGTFRNAWRTRPATRAVYSRAAYGLSSPLAAARRPDYMHVEALTTLPALLDLLSIDQPILIGHSDGASIALIHTGARVRAVRAVAPWHRTSLSKRCR